MRKDDFEVTEKADENASVFELKGRLNTISAEWFQHKLESALQDGQKNIVLNMSKVEFLSSSGIRVILKTYKQATEKGCKLGIEQPSECVRNVLGMVALKELLITKYA